jgi:RNA polymerase sigma-B factor
MTRDETICSLLPIVSRVARRVSIHVAGAELDDLVGYGCVGLVRAVDAFDADRGVPLVAYATRRVLWAILRGIERFDLVPVTARTEAREAERERLLVAQQIGRIPSDGEMAARRPRFHQARALVHQFTAARLHDPECCEIPAAEDPVADLIATQERDEARSSLALLPPKERRALALRFYGGLSQRAIAPRMGISSQRVGQLQIRGLSRLRDIYHVGATDVGITAKSVAA